ncbi:hypothetical protein [Phytohabitans rumicis]|uniref:hypothetical protein n=1 Tax=Phytohabitans rumicis TaxID=1076125 RepID=UPI00156358B9|nr:hypothetical protein [Phytohabitans rumicis]
MPPPLISRRPPAWPTDPPTRCRKELAHIRCGHLDDASGQDLHRGRFETEAENVAHIVLRAVGLDSAAYSDAYVFGWADGNLDLIKQSAETVLRVARHILTDLTPPDELDPTADHTAGDPADPDLTAAATASPGDLTAEVA